MHANVCYFLSHYSITGVTYEVVMFKLRVGRIYTRYQFFREESDVDKSRKTEHSVFKKKRQQQQQNSIVLNFQQIKANHNQPGVELTSSKQECS